MTISNELFLSLLAMDSYNRGYNPGISGLGGLSSKIGTANLSQQSNISETSADVAAGFYASSYTIGTGANARTIISYRGTDNPDFFGTGSGASDVWSGWITGTGTLVNAKQADLAAAFYNTVTGGDVLGGIGTGAILTGHSLGGAGGGGCSPILY